jgi:hypothetical protein
MESSIAARTHFPRMFAQITLLLAVSLILCGITEAFAPARKVSCSPVTVHRGNGAKSLTAVLDVLAGLYLVAAMHGAPINPVHLSSNHFTSINVAATEVRQGMYKEYTVETNKVDTSALDEIKRGYKTAEETDEGKGKYWAILAVLVAGSFIIPMVQYYWYVAEED